MAIVNGTFLMVAQSVMGHYDNDYCFVFVVLHDHDNLM